ncbi:hypothetical protein [Methanothrix sp.]|uniref:hypothetical protein n=1 Tax=Methanothrix sp. TaxID=90426 RepID=UPI002356D7A3|nr:hypothetical protein [Methanothrix sp.]
MSKNPEIARLASGLAAYQDAIRSANEDLIKLSQRFGRMMPRLQKLDSSSILLWLGLYNKITFCSCRSIITRSNGRGSMPRWRLWMMF